MVKIDRIDRPCEIQRGSEGQRYLDDFLAKGFIFLARTINDKQQPRMLVANG